MTLDEAIKHAEEVAEKYERHLKVYENMGDDLFREEENECKDCADEHRQLAGWLKELKELREQEPCEDVISRRAVLDIVKFEENWLFDAKSNNADTDIAFSGIRTQVAKLSSVTKALEPCEDAISRKSMLDYLKYLHGEMSEEEFIKALPSVIPTRPAGHWINHSDEGYVECSNCGSATNCDGNIADLHFCFSCGAKMESEE